MCSKNVALGKDLAGQFTGNRSCKKLCVQKMLFWKGIWLDTLPGTAHVKSRVFKKNAVLEKDQAGHATGNRSLKKLSVQKMLLWKRIWFGHPTGNRSCKELCVQTMLFWGRIWLDSPPGTDHVKSCVFKKCCFGRESGWTRHREQIV